MVRVSQRARCLALYRAYMADPPTPVTPDAALSVSSVETASEPRVWIDGGPVAARDAKVSVFDRGFLYGDSVFETLRTYNGKAFALDEHLERLARSAALVHIELPVSLDRLREEVASALEQVSAPESYVRLMLTRGVGAMGLDPGMAVQPLRVMIVAPLSPPPQEAYETGVSVITYATQRAGDATPAAGAKIGNYLVAVLAMRTAREHSAVEALIVDSAGHVVEGATSNVFAVSKGVLHTPSEREGILAGITRRTLLDVAATLGIEVRLGPLERQWLLTADEVFISSSIREILPVVRVDDRVIGTGLPGPVTQRLRAGFRRRVLGGRE